MGLEKNRVTELIPNSLLETAENFIQLLKAYYEFTELPGNPSEIINKELPLRAIETATAQFIEDIYAELGTGYYLNKNNALSNIENVLSNLKLIYESKGTHQSIKILFRLLFNEDAEIWLPRDYIFKPSDGGWKQDYAVICNLVSGDPLELIGQRCIVVTNYPNMDTQYTEMEINHVELKTENVYQLYFNSEFSYAFYFGSLIKSLDESIVLEAIPTMSAIYKIINGGTGFGAYSLYDIPSYTRNEKVADFIKSYELEDTYNFYSTLYDYFVLKSYSRLYKSTKMNRDFEYETVNKSATLDGLKIQEVVRDTLIRTDIDYGQTRISVDYPQEQKSVIKTTQRLNEIPIQNIKIDWDEVVSDLMKVVISDTECNLYDFFTTAQSFISDVSIDLSGSGYTTNDVITVSDDGGNGSGAKLSFTIRNEINSFAVVDPGSGYHIDSTTLNIIGDGTGATASPVITDGIISSYTINQGGTRYTTATATIVGDGTGAEIELILEGGEINGINLSSGGSGYTYADIIIEGNGEFALAEAVLLPAAIDSITVESPGNGYTTASVFIFDEQNNGSGAAATVNLGGLDIADIIIDHSGSNYLDDGSTLITITGNGQDATAIPSIINGLITGVTVTDPGHDYTNQTTISVIDSSGSGAGAAVSPIIEDGFITDVNVISAGTGYYYAYVTIIDSSGSGSGAVIKPIITTGGVNSYQVVSTGKNYNAATTSLTIHGNGTGAQASVIITDGLITGVSIDNPGLNYQSGTTTFVVEDSITSDGADCVISPIITDGLIDDIIITNSGSGYTYADISITGAGSNAAATAVISTGFIDSVTLDNPGSNYIEPKIILSGDGIGGEVTIDLVTRGIDSINVINPGRNYTQANILIEGDGFGAAVSSIDYAGGPIIGYNIINWGSGYTTATVNITGDGSSADFDANITDGGITSIILTDKGVNYTAATIQPVVSGSGGVIKPIIIDGEITEITITKPGSGYISDVTSIVFYGDGINAEATPNIQNGCITKTTLINGGSGYTTATVNITDGTGSEAVITPIIISGHIVDFTIDNYGHNYSNPTVEIVGDGANAELSVELDNGVITSITMDNVGSGYSYADAIIEISGSNFISNTNMDIGLIDSVSIENGGIGYVSPIITIDSETGTNAAFSVTLDSAQLGDINNDGVIDANDVELLIRRLIYEPITEAQAFWITNGIESLLELEANKPIITTDNLGQEGKFRPLLLNNNDGFDKVVLTDFGYNYPRYFASYIDSINGGAPAVFIMGSTAIGKSPPLYINANGFPSDTSKIHDNFFYQKYSYVIKSNLSYSDFEIPLKKTVHPAGFKAFSEQTITSQIDLFVTLETPESYFYNHVFIDRVNVEERDYKTITKPFVDTTSKTDVVPISFTKVLQDYNVPFQTVFIKSFNKKLKDYVNKIENDSKSFDKVLRDSKTAIENHYLSTTKPLVDSVSQTDSYAKTFTKSVKLDIVRHNDFIQVAKCLAYMDSPYTIDDFAYVHQCYFSTPVINFRDRMSQNESVTISFASDPYIDFGYFTDDYGYLSDSQDIVVL